MDASYRKYLTSVENLSVQLLDHPSSNPFSNVQQLAFLLSGAGDLQKETSSLETQIREEHTLLTELKHRQQSAVDAEVKIRNLLYPIPGKTLIEKQETIQKRLNSYRRATALLSDQQMGSLSATTQIQDRITQIRDSMRDNNTSQQECYNRQGALEQQILSLSSESNEKPILSRIRDLSVRQQQLLELRDTDALLYGLLKVSEQSFRDQHQPDVILRASSYLSQITAGRYSRIVISENQQGIRIFSSEAGTFIDPQNSHLSQGTSEQVFLALRLGLIDHLDPPNETLPLLLDETFVNWDGQRLVSGLSSLQHIAVHRQVMLFTCHPWMLEALKKAGINNYNVISLEK